MQLPGQKVNTRAIKSRHPVIIATGEKSLDQLDFQLPGPIELEWHRQYRSGDARSDGWFGQGWSHPLATELWIQDDVLRYWDEQGREVVLPAIAVGQEHFQAYEQFTLIRPGANHWALRHNQGQTHHFRQRHARQWRLPLEVLQDRNLRRILLQFNDGDFGDGFDAQAAIPRPPRLIDSAGRKLHLLWTDQKQLSQVVVESGDTRVVLASYRYGHAAATAHGLPDLLSHIDANGHTRTFSWDQHLLVGYTLATGQRFSNRYDRMTPTGRVIESLALDDGTGDWFEYNGRTTRVRDRLGRETVYVSNARQSVVAVHDAEGNVTRTPFNAEGRPEGSTDALGRTSSITFDARGNLTLMMDAAGNATKVEYNALELPIKLTDAMGGEWVREYDARGNFIASTDPLGHTTRYEVDATGQVTAIIDALDKRKTLQWDDAGNLVAYTDCSGHTTRYAYDDLGHLRSVTDALGQTNEHQFDARGELVQVTQPDGAKHHYTWDGEGNLVRYVDPLGQATAWKYNGAGAPLVRVDALGHTLKYQYDHAGRLAVLTNENGEHTTFGYDLLDRLTDEIGFDGRHQRYIYNAAGELTHVIERGGSEFGPGKVTRFERDALGRMTEKRHIGEAVEHAASSQFAYDPLGRLTKASNAVSDVSFAYDPLGQLLAEKQRLHGWVGDKVFEFKHQYDALGNRTQTVLPNGRKLNHLFYGSGHLHQVNLDGQVISEFERDALYREVRRTQGALVSEFAYDPAGRLSSQRVVHRGSDASNSAGMAPLTKPSVPALSSVRDFDDLQSRMKGVIERHYHYDLSGQLVQWMDRHRGLTRYRYDAAGRITRAQIGLLRDWGPAGVRADAPGNSTGHPMAANELFHWDAASNPLPVDASARAGGSGNFVRGNRLLVLQDARYAYDEHGNLIERLKWKRDSSAKTRTLFEWDAAHQLVRAKVTLDADDKAILATKTFAYDALGRQVAKLNASGISQFAWDEERITLELLASFEVTYIYLPESFSPLAQIDDGEVQHIHTDHIDTPFEATNSLGSLTWRAIYRAWGGLFLEDISRIQQYARFPGQIWEADVELSYNRHRYFEPFSGLFVSQDPIGLNGGWHLYRYAPNPTTWIDPLGLMGFRVAVRTEGGIRLGKRLKRKQAIKRVQRGQDVHADSRSEAVSLAKSCAVEKPMKHDPHPDREGNIDGRLPHVHPNNHEGLVGDGHIFFPG